MKPKIILCLALVLSGGLLTGCDTEYVGESHVSITNLHGDGRTETNTNSLDNECSGLINGKTMMAFSLGNPPCSLVLYYPTNNLNQISQLQTDSQQAYAWLVRTQLDCQTLLSVKTPAALPFPNSEALHGKIEVGKYDWRHKNLFHIGVDLAGDDGTVLKGEFNYYDKTKFDPKQLLITPYVIFVLPFSKE